MPARIDALYVGALAAGCEFSSPTDFGLGPIAAIHTAEYLHFLKTIYPRWQRIENASDEVIPNIHPDKRTASYPKSANWSGRIPSGLIRPARSARTPGRGAYWAAQSALAGVPS